MPERSIASFKSWGSAYHCFPSCFQKLILIGGVGLKRRLIKLRFEWIASLVKITSFAILAKEEVPGSEARARHLGRSRFRDERDSKNLFIEVDVLSHDDVSREEVK